MAKSRKSAIELNNQGIVDDIFKAAGKQIVKQMRRDVRKINKSYQKTNGLNGSGKVGPGLGLKPHVRGAEGKSNWSNPKFRELSNLEDNTELAFIKAMGGRKKAGSRAFSKAMFEEFDAVEKRAIKRAAAKNKKAPVKKVAPKKKK